jgi:hypothetical protein
MPAKADGTACNDGNACTRSDACRAGVCTGADPVTCGGGDSCREATCNPSTGACTGGRVKRDGAACDDGNACTQTDVCRQGRCVGRDPLLCSPPDRCHVAFCRPRKGGCRVKRILPQRVCAGRPAGKGKDKERWR